MSDNFKEYFKAEVSKEMSRGKLAGVRAARAYMQTAFESAYQTLRRYGTCKLRFEESPENVAICIASPAGDMSWKLDACNTPEWKEWSEQKPSEREMTEFKKAFIATLAKVFQVTLNEAGEATLSAEKI